MRQKNIFHLFESDRTNYTILWPKYRLRKTMELWAAIKELITAFQLATRRAQDNVLKIHTDINHKHYIENNLQCIANNVPNLI